MATTKTPHSPFTRAFTTAMRRGTPAGVAAQNIAKRNRKTINQVFTSLFQAGQVKRQKMGGQWIYFPVEGTKPNASFARNSQAEMWQAFVDWTIASGNTTPERITANNRTRQQFVNFMKKYFGRQFASANGTTTTSRSASTTRGRSTRSTVSNTRSTQARKNSTTSTRKTTGTRTLRISGSRTRTMRRAA